MQIPEKEIIISPITTFCNEKLIYSTDVGVRHSDLILTAWGETEELSRINAQVLRDLIAENAILMKVIPVS